MYSFSPKLRLYSIVAIVLGLLMFGIGYINNSNTTDEQIEEQIHHTEQKYKDNPTLFSKHIEHQDAAEHLEHAKHKVHNEPMSALLIPAMLFFGIGCTALFFYSIQHAATVGWSVIVLRVMEGVASIIPWAGALLLIIMIVNAMGGSHMYHWMDPELTDPNSEHFDVLLFSKKPFLNIPGFLIRSFIYVGGCSFFLFKLKSLSKKLDETKANVDYKKLFNWSVGYIAFFAFASAIWAWDWLMSLDPHWFSTLYIWYTMVSCLASAIACIILVSVYLKKKGVLPQFNDNHLHDLGKFLFAFSMLWTYLFFCQFMLYWYANIPEEAAYFFGRFQVYENTFLWMLIPNFVMPLFILVSSSIKRNYKVVTAMSVVVILGHWLDYFNVVMPGAVGEFWQIGFLEIGAFVFVIGLFIFVVMTAISKLKLISTGNPYLHESEIYEYPY